MGFENLAVVMVYACVATFVFALPASALLIGIGEWKKLGTRYHVGAGFLAATVSWLAVIAEAFLHDRRGDGVPFLRFDDLIMLLSVGFGGAVGGFVFARARNALVRWLGALGFPTPEPEREHP